MSDVIGVKVDSSRIRLRLDQMPDEVRSSLRDTIFGYGGEVADAARSRAETLLQVKTGKFVSRIRFSFRERKNSLTGRVYSTAPTAQLFEYGGKTGAHEILPKKADALAFIFGGKAAFFASVQHPGGTYAARNIIHGAFDPLKSQIEAGMEAAVDSTAARVGQG